MSGLAIVEQSSFSLPRIAGLPLDHAVNLTTRDLELEFERTFNLMGRGASGPSDLPELPELLLAAEVHAPNFASLMFDEYVRRQVDRNVVAGSLNLIETQVWHAMRELDEDVRKSRDTIELLARIVVATIDMLRPLSIRDPVWTVFTAVVELEGHLDELHWVRDFTLQLVARMASAIEDWIAKVGTLAQIPGADGRLPSRAQEVAEEYRRHFGTVRHEFDILRADGNLDSGSLNLLDADLDDAVGYGFEEFGGVQIGEDHDVARMRRYVTANLEKWQRQYGLGAVLVEMRHVDQKLLDDYKGGKEKLLDDLWDRGYYVDYGVEQTEAFRDLIHEAWRLKIPTVAIDTAYRPSVDHARLRASDPYWVASYHEVRKALPLDTPVLVVTGADHSWFGAHVGIPTIDDVSLEGLDMERRARWQMWQSDPGTLALDPGTRAWPEPERKESYTEQEFTRYLKDWETFIATHDGATIVVNPPNPTTP